MKISQVLAFVDKMKPGNPYDTETKLLWLNELEGDIQSRLFHTAPQEIIQYTMADMDTDLLVPVPHDKIYWMWVAAMIDFANGEYDRYQNTMQLVNDAWDTYAKWFHRKFHEDVGGFLYIGGTTKYGLSAYQIAVNHGFRGDEAAWLESLRGPQGEPGQSADGNLPQTDAEFFVIDHDGVIALAPAYRGVSDKDKYSEVPLSVSDRGVGQVGSAYGKLPKHIVIPQMIGSIAVNALAPGMFYTNDRVESIHLPKGIREIPLRFADNAIRLRKVTGTEQITKIGNCGFQTSGLEEAWFPNLEEMVNAPFSFSCYLKVVDIGDKITTLPKRTFFFNTSLSCVYGGKNVTSVGVQAFACTHSLKNLPFLGQLTSVGENAFRRSRLDYDWTWLHDADFWTEKAAQATACEVPVVSAFWQENPDWKDLLIGTNTAGVTYYNGCLTCAAAAAWSALTGEPLATPMAYVEMVEKKNSTLVGKNPSYFDTQREWFAALGCEMSQPISYTGEGLNLLYEALENDYVIITECITENQLTGHAILIHGVNELGELMCVNSQNSVLYKFGIQTPSHYTLPVQNLVCTKGSNPNKFYIVRKT